MRILHTFHFPHSSLRQVVWTRLKLNLFYNTISCPLVHRSSKGIHNLTLFLERVYLLSTIRFATCHNSIGDWSRRYIFQGICHMSPPDWLCHFKCLGQLPISSGIPSLPFTFLKFSPLTSLVLAPRLEVSSLVLSSPSRARYFPYLHF